MCWAHINALPEWRELLRKLSHSHLGASLPPSQVRSAIVLNLRELKLSCSRGTCLTWMSIHMCVCVWDVRSVSVWQAEGNLCSGFHGLHFHGSFNTSPHPLLGIYQWKSQLVVEVESDLGTTWDSCIWCDKTTLPWLYYSWWLLCDVPAVLELMSGTMTI